MRPGRPRVRGSGRRQPPALAADAATTAGAAITQPQPKRRESFSYRHKLDVIAFFLQHNGDTAATVEHFYPSLPKDQRRTKMQLVSSWVKQREKIEQTCERGLANQRNRRLRGHGATLPRDVEDQIVAWMRAQERAGVAVTAKMLQETACQLAATCDFDDGVFTASWSWRIGFLRRHFPSGRVGLSPELQSAREHADSAAATTLAAKGSEAQVSGDGGSSDDCAGAATVSDAESTGATAGKTRDEVVDTPAQEVPAQEAPAAPEETLASILEANGLAQYLSVLQDNGFDAPDSLAGIEEYFGELGVKLGHRKRFKDLSILHSPGMVGIVPFMVVLVDLDAHWGWSQRRKFIATSVCQQWPAIVRTEVQNLFFGRICAQSDSTIEYASDRDVRTSSSSGGSANEPQRCKGEVVFFATLRALYEAGYTVRDWKPFQHRLMP